MLKNEGWVEEVQSWLVERRRRSRPRRRRNNESRRDPEFEEFCEDPVPGEEETER